MPQTSAIPNVKAALATLLRDQPQLSTVTVFEAPVTDVRTLPDAYLIFRRDDSQRKYVGQGARIQDETVRLQIGVEVITRLDDPVQAETDFWNVVGGVELAVLSDFTLAGTAYQAEVTEVRQHEWGPIDQGGWTHQATLEVTIETRIGPATSPSVP